MRSAPGSSAGPSSSCSAGNAGARPLHLKAAGGATAVLVEVMLLGSWAVTAAEHGAPRANLPSYPKALWWSIETVTTVGYGD